MAKYILFGYTGIAIRVDALQAVDAIRFVGRDYIEGSGGNGYVFFDKGKLDSRDCTIIDEAEILAKNPKEEGA